jgi:hypothetical protein
MHKAATEVLADALRLEPDARAEVEKPTTRAWIEEEDGLPVGYLLALVHEVPENPFVRARR